MAPEFIVAIVAAVLGGGAFIAACLQALLEYLSSSGNKAKCSVPAIGSAHKLVKTSWSWSQWKLKVRYPLLNLEVGAVLDEAWAAKRNVDICLQDGLDVLLDGYPNRAWATVSADDRLSTWDVADEFAVLVTDSDSKTPRSGKPVGIKDLNWAGTWAFLRYRLRHPLNPLQKPRASWAQLLVALGIRDVKRLLVRLVDGDTVHSNMDTPFQRIKLRDLGQIAFILGFREVSIDVQNRDFRAYSPIASITTEEVQVLGKVLRFEGDVLELHALVARCDFRWALRAGSLTNGQLSFGMYTVNGISMPLTTLSNAIVRGLTSREYRTSEIEANKADMRGFSAGPVLREALLLKDIFGDEIQAELAAEYTGGASRMQFESDLPRNQALTAYMPPETFAKAFLEGWFLADDNRTGVSKIDTPTCLAKWQNATSSRVPTLYAAASFMSIHAVICAFPSRAVLYPILPWVRLRARSFYNRHAEKPLFKISEELIQSIINGNLGFARGSSNYLVARNLGRNVEGLVAWGTTDLKHLYDLIPPGVQGEIIPHPTKWKASMVLVKETLELLKTFEVKRWAAEMTEKQKASFSTFKTLNLLWYQIVVLDIAIQYYIKGNWVFQPLHESHLEEREDRKERLLELWGTQEAPVAQSIVKAWRPTNTSADYVRAEIVHGNHAGPGDGADETGEGHSGDRDGAERDERAAASSTDEGDSSDDEGQHRPENLGVTSSRTPPGLHSNMARITEAGEPQCPLVFQDWQLAKHLERNENVFPGARTKGTTRKCEFLADMLELRAIFVIALLCLHPDSSDIYLTEDEEIEMPMA